jgi:hypothetical protein
LLAFVSDRDLRVPPTVEFAEEGFLRHSMSSAHPESWVSESTCLGLLQLLLQV